MKSDTVSGGLITTGGGILFTFQGAMQVAGLCVAIAGLVIGYLNWKENKRSNDVKEAQQRDRKNNASTKNSET